MNTAANKASSTVLNWTERGLVPDSVIRAGIRRLCRKRLQDIGAQDIEASAVRLGLEDIGLHYATTLNHWRKNFFDRISEIRAQGFSDSFIRMWEYYLCYCEAAFLERAISDVQILFAKPENRMKPL